MLLIACGALARETLAITKGHGWPHMDLTCLPALLHNSPDKITVTVCAWVTKHRDSHQNIFVVYADCGTGGRLQTTCDDMGVKMIASPHCYSFYEGNDRFCDEYANETTTFYLTDFLVRQLDTFVWKPME